MTSTLVTLKFLVESDAGKIAQFFYLKKGVEGGDNSPNCSLIVTTNSILGRLTLPRR